MAVSCTRASFMTYLIQKNAATVKSGSEVTEGIETDTIWDSLPVVSY